MRKKRTREWDDVRIAADAGRAWTLVRPGGSQGCRHPTMRSRDALGSQRTYRKHHFDRCSFMEVDKLLHPRVGPANGSSLPCSGPIDIFISCWVCIVPLMLSDNLCRHLCSGDQLHVFWYASGFIGVSVLQLSPGLRKRGHKEESAEYIHTWRSTRYPNVRQ